MQSTDTNTAPCVVEKSGAGLLEADTAREILFDKILDQLAASGLFSNSTIAPTIFIVYAHDNDKEGAAYDEWVRKIITWLKKIHARILSDQSALPPLHARIEGTDAIRNILANQVCLLPPITDSDGIPTTTSVDKVIVCGSEVLERYYKNSSALSYIEDVLHICEDAADQSMIALSTSIRNRVEIECGKDEFHHIFTELAFLEFRKSCLPDTHGMVPVVLSQINPDEAPMRYLPLFSNTDVKLKLKSPAARSLHKLFFKLVEQLFPDDRDFIRPFKQCYESVSSELELENGASVTQEQLDDIVNPCINKAYQQYWGLFSVFVRDGKLQAYTGKLSDQVSQVLEMAGLGTQHEILKWLSPVAASELHGRFHDSGTSRMEGTCDWVIKDEKFRRWYSSKGSTLLFLCGNMGTGKTYSTSRVIDWVKHGLSTNDNDEAFAYFYCNKQDPARREPKEILRNIIRQLATGPWKAAQKSGTIHKTVYNLWEKSQEQGISSTFAEWEACLLALIDTYPRTTIVLDALDECGKGQRLDLINLLVALATRQSKDQPVKIFVSTRPEEDMLRHFDNHPAIRVQEKHNTDDIAIFVRNQIAKHHKWSKMSEQFRIDVIDTLLEKSGDMFLFASLQIEHLLLCKTEPALKARLEKLPDSLEKTYEEIYQMATFDPDERNLFDRAIRWVMCSAKPLTTNELVLAICQDPESDEVMPQRQDVDEELILELCHNFLCLEVNLNDKLDDSSDDSYDVSSDDDEGESQAGWRLAYQQVWRLAHQAVAEFFEGSVNCSYDLAHYEVGKVCLTVLLDFFGGESARSGDDSDDVPAISKGYVCPCRKNLTPTEDSPFESLHKEMKYSLAEYAIFAWPTHVRAQEHREARSVAGLSQVLQQFLGQPDEGSAIYERWYAHILGPFRYATRYMFISPETPLDYPEKSKMSPIALACCLGFYTTLAKWWDSPTFDKNVVFRIDHFHILNPELFAVDHLPLTFSLVALACVNDEVKILQHLLDRKARIYTIEEYEAPPIVVAAANNSVNSLKELLRRPTEISSPFTRRYGHVVYFAIKSNSLKVLELLLDPAVAGPEEVQDIWKEFQWDNFMWPDTMKFSMSKDLVRWLLANGADVNAKFEDKRFRNAIEGAVYHDCPASILHLLIEHGAHVTARAVACSLLRKKEEIPHLLLGHTPDLNETWSDYDGNNTSALIETVQSGNADGVRLLIKHGADVNQQVGGRYGDALDTVFWATLDRRQKGYDSYPTAAVFEALVEEGASLETLVGDHLNFALVAAALAGSEGMVQLFLARGANPNAFGEHEWTTALGAAADSDHPRAPHVVRMLLDAGADVNAYFPESIKDKGLSFRLALDFPLNQMLECDYQEEKWDAVLQLASLLLSNGAVWDIDIAKWRECVNKRAPKFSRQNAHSLDQLLQMLQWNRTSFFLKHPGAASDDRWRIKNIEDLSLDSRKILSHMELICHWVPRYHRPLRFPPPHNSAQLNR